MSRAEATWDFIPAKVQLTVSEPWGKKRWERNYSFTLDEATAIHQALGRALRAARRGAVPPKKQEAGGA